MIAAGIIGIPLQADNDKDNVAFIRKPLNDGELVTEVRKALGDHGRNGRNDQELHAN